MGEKGVKHYSLSMKNVYLINKGFIVEKQFIIKMKDFKEKC